MPDTFHLWLGSNRIQSSENRIAIPPQVVELEIAEITLPVHWLVEEKLERVAIAKEALSDGGSRAGDVNPTLEMDRIAHTTVGENRVTTIPKKFFPDYEGKAMGSMPVSANLQFEHGQRCHFITSTTLWEKGA